MRLTFATSSGDTGSTVESLLATAATRDLQRPLLLFPSPSRPQNFDGIAEGLSLSNGFLMTPDPELALKRDEDPLTDGVATTWAIDDVEMRAKREREIDSENGDEDLKE